MFHLEKAAALCPTDARVQYQLGKAIQTKIDCEKSLLTEGAEGHYEITGLELRDESVDLARAADAFERSAQLESAAVKVCVNGIEDLAICSNSLAETRCNMGQFDEALDSIDQYAECGSLRSALAFEDTSDQLSKLPSYEWIQTQGNEDTDENKGKRRNVAARTVGDVRVFEPEDIALLRAAADKRFALAAGIQTSRYTMQYAGMIIISFVEPFFLQDTQALRSFLSA